MKSVKLSVLSGLDLVCTLEAYSYFAFLSVKMSAAEQKVKSPKPSRRSVTSPKLRTKTTNFNKPLRLRIVLVGDECTGKSCLIKRYCEKRFVTKYLPTIGIDYGATKIFVDKREVGIHIFDTSGMTTLVHSKQFLVLFHISRVTFGPYQTILIINLSA